MNVKKVILVLLILRVAAPLSLAGYVWYRNRGEDVSLNFDKIVCGVYIRARFWPTPLGVPSRFPNNRYLYS